MNTDREVAAFDVDLPNVDHVTIYKTPGGTNRYQAVPFIERDDTEHTWYHEPHDFTPTDEYRRAVAEHTSIDIRQITLTRNLKTYHA